MASKVTYTRKGDVHTFETGIAGCETLVIDHTHVPADQRGGMAKQLLASAALACYAAALAGALEARGAHYETIEGDAEMELGPNESGQGRVQSMTLSFRVTLPEDDSEIFERCARIMRHGCLVTGSLHDGIEMHYELKPCYAR